MTKLRDLGSFHGAVGQILDTIGIDGCMNVTNKQRSQVYSYADGADIGVQKALALDIAFNRETGKPGPILETYMRQYRYAARGRCESSYRTIDQAALDVGAAIGGFHQAVCEARKDHSEHGASLSPNERTVLRNHLLQVIAEAQALLQGELSEDQQPPK